MRWIAGTRPQLSSLNYQLGQKPTENTEDTEILNKGLRAYYLISDAPMKRTFGFCQRTVPIWRNIQNSTNVEDTYRQALLMSSLEARKR